MHQQGGRRLRAASDEVRLSHEPPARLRKPHIRRCSAQHRRRPFKAEHPVASGFVVLLVCDAGLGIVPAVAQAVDLADPPKTSLGLLLPILTAASGASVQPAGTSVSALMGDREGIGPPKLNSQCEYTVSCASPWTLVRHRFFHSSPEHRGNGQSRRSEPDAS